MHLPPPVRAESVKRLAQLRQFFAGDGGEGIAGAEPQAALGGRADQGRPTRGFESVADLMNNIDATTSREILEMIEMEEAKLAASIRDMMFHV